MVSTEKALKQIRANQKVLLSFYLNAKAIENWLETNPEYRAEFDTSVNELLWQLQHNRKKPSRKETNFAIAIIGEKAAYLMSSLSAASQSKVNTSRMTPVPIDFDILGQILKNDPALLTQIEAWENKDVLNRMNAELPGDGVLSEWISINDKKINDKKNLGSQIKPFSISLPGCSMTDYITQYGDFELSFPSVDYKKSEMTLYPAGAFQPTESKQSFMSIFTPQEAKDLLKQRVMSAAEQTSKKDRIPQELLDSVRAIGAKLDDKTLTAIQGLNEILDVLNEGSNQGLPNDVTTLFRLNILAALSNKQITTENFSSELATYREDINNQDVQPVSSMPTSSSR